MEEIFLLLRCKATNELLYIFGLKEKEDYNTVRYKGVSTYQLNLSTDKSKVIAELLKDLDIYIPEVKKYLSDYILLKKTPSKEIVNYINLFDMSALFMTYVSEQRLIQAQLKCCGKLIYRSSPHINFNR